jgi:MFS transporter, FSR family, fosmidomycin resistance protein
MTKVISQEADIPVAQPEESEFRTERILTIAGGHFIHDTYTAFLAPLLPKLIDNLSLSLTQAGSLSVFLQLAAFFNVFIGYFADKVSLQFFVILAPAITGTLMSAVGFTSSYLSLGILLTAAGISVSAFHVPAPAMIGQLAGRRVGRGMSFFMAGGELGRAVGPLLAVRALELWGLEGIWRLAIVGWAASAILFLRFRHMGVQKQEKKKRVPIRSILPRVQRLFIPLSAVMFLRNFLLTGMTVFLVVLLEDRGYTVAQGSFALALWSFAGVGGALFGGTISDNIGRKRTIATAMLSSGVLMTIFLSIDGWLLIPVLLLSGFTTLSIAPVLQAMVLEQVPEQRATANGLFMSMSFLIRSAVTLLIGIMGDSFGLEAAFMVTVVLTFLAVPFVFLLPDLEKRKHEELV